MSRIWMMDSDRKRELLAAEARFIRLEQLSRRLADAGIIVFGAITTPDATSATEFADAPEDGASVSVGFDPKP